MYAKVYEVTFLSYKLTMYLKQDEFAWIRQYTGQRRSPDRNNESVFLRESENLFRSGTQFSHPNFVRIFV